MTRFLVAALAAALALAWAGSAQAMLPADGGGGGTSKPAKPRKQLRQPGVKGQPRVRPAPTIQPQTKQPVSAPPPVRTRPPGRTKKPVREQQPVGEQQPVREPPQPAEPAPPAQPQRSEPAPRRADPEPEQPSRAALRDQARRYLATKRELNQQEDGGHLNMRLANGLELGSDPRVKWIADRIERQRGERRAKRRDREQLNRETAAYVAALDQIERDGGALRMGTANALEYGDDDRVVRRAHRIIDRRERRERLERQAERREREARRIVRQGQLYLAGDESFGDDPRVKRFTDRFQRKIKRLHAEQRRSDRKELIRDRARSYIATLDQIERDGGALRMGTAQALELADDPRVKRAVRHIRRHRRVRREAREYADVLEQIESRGGALSMGTANALENVSDDPAVRRLANRMLKTRRRRDRAAGYPYEGPALAHAKWLGVAVPFPGRGEYIGMSFQARCLQAVTPQAALSCAQGKGAKPPLRIEMSSTLSGKVSRGEPTLAPSGKEYETLTVDVDLRSTVGGAADLPRGVSVNLSHFTGKDWRYQLLLTSPRADEIADGDADPPHPLDPRSLDSGESIVLSKEDYEGNSQGVSYHALQAELGFEEGRRLSSGIERLGDDRVRIFVGDEEFVRNAIELKLGTDDLNVAAGMSREFAEGDLRTIDINLNSRRGWDAYQRFVTGGRLPVSAQRGITDSATVDSASWSGSQSLELNIKSLHLGGSSTPFEGQVTETRHADGSLDYAMTDRQGGVTYIQRETKERPGAGWTDARYSLLLQGADSGYAESLMDLHGDPPELDGDEQNLRIDFSESELMAIRQEALEQISHYTKSDDEDGLSPDEVDEAIGDDPYSADIPWRIPGGQTTSYLTFLAAARNPSAVLSQLQTMSHGNPTKLIEDLYMMQVTPMDSEGNPSPSPLDESAPSPPGDITLFGLDG